LKNKAQLFKYVNKRLNHYQEIPILQEFNGPEKASTFNFATHQQTIAEILRNLLEVIESDFQ